MALGELQPLDPTSRAATVLGSGGPSALEVAYKRKGMEIDLGKQLAASQAAADKLKQKDQQALGKQLELEPEAVKLNHAAYYAKQFGDATKEVKDILKRNNGELPRAGTDDYMRILAIKQGLKQTKASSDQLFDERNRLLNLIDSRPVGTFLPGAREYVNATYSDPKYLASNTMPEDNLAHYFDVNGYLKPFFTGIEEDQTAWASDDGTQSGTTTWRIPKRILDVAVQAAADPLAHDAFVKNYELMSPERRAQIDKLALDSKITKDAAMALELGTGLVGNVKKTHISEQKSSGSAGVEADKAGSLWFGEYLGGLTNGKYGTTPRDDGKGPLNLFNPSILDPGQTVFKDNTLNGFVYDDKTVWDPAAKTHKKITREIKDNIVDRENQTLTIVVGDAGNNKNNVEIEIPFDQLESKLGPKVLGFNKDKIRAKGQYDLSAEQEGYGSVKGTQGGNIVKMGGGKETAAERLKRIKEGK